MSILKALAFCILLASSASHSGSAERYQLNVESQTLEQALRSLANASGRQLLFPYDQMEALKSISISGRYTLEEALGIILKDTSLSGELTTEGVILVTPIQKKSDRGSEMNSKKKILAATIGLFMGAGGASVGFAEEVESSEGLDWLLEEVVVTATKREQNIQDVPISILALQGEDLVAQGVSDLQSLSLAVPSLLVAESGSFQRRISIRGIGNSFGSSSLIGMYVDEASVAGLPANQIDLRVHDVERIEILKGPQGTLYGEGSVGGTIRYITKDPELDNVGAELSVDGSSTSGGDESYDIKGIVNIPLAEDSLGFRIVGQYVNSGGWIDQPALSKSDINDSELYNIRAKLLWLPSDNLEIKATAIIHRNDAGAQNIGEDENGNYNQSFGDLSTPSAEDNYDLYNLSVNYDLGNMSLVSSTSYLDYDNEVNNYGYQCCVPTGTPGEFWNVFFQKNNIAAEVLTQELRLSTNDDGPFYWSTGVFIKDAQLIPVDALGGLFGLPAGTLGVSLFEFGSYQEEESESWAVFGETSYAVTDQLDIGAGIRYFEDDRKFRGAMTGAFQEESFDSVNPKVFLNYAVSDEVNVYANIAKGFRSGGFNGAGEPPFDPENVWSYEIGSKMSLLDGRLKTELALFFSSYEDYQIVGIVPTLGLNVTSNGGEAEITGVDLSLVWLASELLELGFNGNYMDTEFVSIDVTGSSYAEGDPLDMVPQYGYSFWANQSFNWAENAPGFLRIDYSQQGKSNYRNRSFGPDYHSQSDVVEMLNARIGWANNDWSAELYALNLLDERGLIGPLDIELVSARPRPRTVGVKLGFKF